MRVFNSFSKILVWCFLVLATSVSATVGDEEGVDWDEIRERYKRIASGEIEAIDLYDYIPLEVGRYWTCDIVDYPQSSTNRREHRGCKLVITNAVFEGRVYAGHIGVVNEGWSYPYTQYFSNGTALTGLEFLKAIGTGGIEGTKFVAMSAPIPTIVLASKVPYGCWSESRGFLVEVYRSSVYWDRVGKKVSCITVECTGLVSPDTRSIAHVVKGFGIVKLTVERLDRGSGEWRQFRIYYFKNTRIFGR